MFLGSTPTTPKSDGIFGFGKPLAVRCDIVYNSKHKTKSTALYYVNKIGYLKGIGHKLQKGIQINTINKEKASISIKLDETVKTTLEEISYDAKFNFICNAIENIQYRKQLEKHVEIIPPKVYQGSYVEKIGSNL